MPKSTRTSTPRPRTKPKAPKPTPRLPQFSGNAALRMDTEEAPMPVARPKPVLEEIVIPEAERATILDLNEHRCKWPVGDPTQPDFYFCGRHSGPGGPYCEDHAKIAFQPSNERRNKDRD